MEVNSEYIKIYDKYLLTLDNHHLKPRKAFPYFHLHPHLEISCVKSGRGEYLVEDRIYEVEKGDVFVFNNIERHALGVHPPEELVNLTMMFDPRFIWSIESNLFDSRYLKIFYERNELFQNRLDRDNPVTEDIRKLIFEIEQEFLNKPYEYELMVKVKLMNILVALIRHFGCTRPEEHDYGRKQDIIQINKVTDYIDANLTGDIKLTDLSGIVYMNPSYFSTFFKKYIGIGPSEYITRKRVNRAMEYLKATDRTILDIANTCGFNNSTNFNKAFKKVTGRTPSEFRYS